MSADAPAAPRSWRRAAPRIVASVLIAGGFVWALRRGGLPFAPPASAWQELRWWCLPAFVSLTLAVAILRTWRWIYLLRPLAPRIDPWRVFGVGLVGFSAVFFAPLRLGEFARPFLMSRDREVTFVEAVGTVAAERVIDGLVLVLLAAISFLFSQPVSPLPDHVGALPIPVSLMPRMLLLSTIMFSTAFGMMALFYFARDTASRWVRAVLGVVSQRLADFGASMVQRLAASFGFLPSWHRAAPFLRNTLLYWLINGLSLFVLLRGVGLDSTVAEAFVTLGVVGLGSLLPAGPGFFGAYQVATYTSLALYNSEPEVLTKGALAVFFAYLVQVLSNALGCGVGFFILARTSPTPASASS